MFSFLILVIELLKIYNNFLYKEILNNIIKDILGIGDWGLGIGDWGLGPIPNPQSPIPICFIYLMISIQRKIIN